MEETWNTVFERTLHKSRPTIATLEE
jgi:hypothetical protein